MGNSLNPLVKKPYYFLSGSTPIFQSILANIKAEISSILTAVTTFHLFKFYQIVANIDLLTILVAEQTLVILADLDSLYNFGFVHKHIELLTKSVS